MNLTPTPDYTNNTNAGTANAAYTYAGDDNHTGGNDNKDFTIDKANAVISITPYSAVYDAAAHGISGTATGVTGEDLGSLLHLGATFTDVPGGTANWTFDGDTNYNPDSGSAGVTITKATATISATPYSVTYDAASHIATGTAKGVLNEDLTGLVLSGTTHTNAGTYATDPWTFTEETRGPIGPGANSRTW